MPDLVLPGHEGPEPDAASLAAKLAVLEIVAGGRDLLVEGERGVDRDTLVYFEALIAMRMAGVLPPDGTVWELGGRRGGLARRFRALFPNVTYVLSVRSEHLAAVRFDDQAIVPVVLDQLPSAELPAPALVVSVAALDTLPPEQTHAALRRAHDLGARWVYSLDRDPHAGVSARGLIAECFWPQEIPVLDAVHLDMGPAAPPDVMRPPQRPPGAFRHLAGRRRLLP